MARLRLGIVGVVIGVLFLAMFARLYSLQVLNAPGYSAAAVSNQVRTVTVQPPRGDILDAAGNPIVDNTTTEAVTLSRYIAQQNPSVVPRLASVLHMTPAAVTAALNDNQFSNYVPVPIATGVPTSVIVYIAEHQSDFPGVSAQAISQRNYPYGATASQLLGYLGPINQSQLAQSKTYQAGDLIGQSGVEASYNNWLYGKPGSTELSVNSAGQVVGTVASTPPTPGDNVQLSLDLGLQKATQAALAYQINKVRGTFIAGAGAGGGGAYAAAPGGAAVVMNPRNGQVLAMASYPTYNPSVWVGGISNAQYANLTSPSSDEPMLNRAIQGLSAPGSTFKLATATAALNTGLITPSTIIDDATATFVVPGCTVGKCVFTEADATGLGPIDLSTAIAASDDVFFYNLGYDFYKAYQTNGQYGFTPIQQTANAYSLGVGTGIDLPGESTGRVDSLAVRKQLCAEAPKVFCPNGPPTWYVADQLEMAFGQGGTLITPIELADAYATFANGGTRYQPQVVANVVSPSGKLVKPFAPIVTGHVPLSPANHAAMLQGFIGAVQNPNLGTAGGTFAGFPFSKMQVAGKTGTATTNHPVPNSLFVAFAGKDLANPRYVVAVLIEQAGYGASDAAPVARNILQYLIAHPAGQVIPPKPSPAQIPELATTTTTTTPPTTTTSSTTSTTQPVTTQPVTTQPVTTQPVTTVAPQASTTTTSSTGVSTTTTTITGSTTTTTVTRSTTTTTAARATTTTTAAPATTTTTARPTLTTAPGTKLGAGG